MEFIIPVRYTGVKNHRVVADNLEDAIKQVTSKAQMDAGFEINLSGITFDVLIPRMMLSDEERESWPYWEFWYSGTDGVDWRCGYTNKGKAGIPDFAESSHPVPSDWLDSWVEDKSKE